VYWLFGFTLAFGEGSSFAGLYPYVAGYKLEERKMFAKWYFELSYASTPSTIVSGAVAERCGFIGYLIYSSTISCKLKNVCKAHHLKKSSFSIFLILTSWLICH
jgi:ammonia channel protein AmtB